jgi:hypothetical protein
MMLLEKYGVHNFRCRANVLTSVDSFFIFASDHMTVYRAEKQYFLLEKVINYVHKYRSFTLGAYISLLFAQLSEVGRINIYIEKYLKELSNSISYHEQKLAPYGAIICFDGDTLYSLIAMHHRFIILNEGIEYVSASRLVTNVPHDARAIEKKELMIKRVKRTKRKKMKKKA